jgi:hypothetical protein
MVVALAAVCAVGGLAACSGGSGGDRSVFAESTMPKADAVRWTGLEDTTGLTINVVHEEGFQDTLVEVVVTGHHEDIDRALSVAEFYADLRPGISVQAPPAGFDAAQVADPRSAQDTWTNEVGLLVHRRAIRGGLPGGEEILFFTAFTT